jgi:hypothetical protein
MVWLNGNLLATSRWSYSADSAVLSVQGLHDLSPEGAWAAAWELTWE